MIDEMQRRAQAVRQRSQIHAWEYRQRHHAKGVWYRLRRVLADAKDGYVISEDEAARLVAEGYEPEHVGAELEPPKVLVFVPRERVERMEGARPIAVSLSAEMLTARRVALVRFP